MSVFLIQSSDGSHDNCVYARPGVSTAEELIYHNYYYFPCWEVSGYQGREFANINDGDKIIHYCARNVKESPSMIRFIYQVTGVEKVPDEACKKAVGRVDAEWIDLERRYPRILRLNRIHTLRNPIKYREVQELVKSGGLSTRMKNCGRLGFNLCQVESSDLDYIMSR